MVRSRCSQRGASATAQQIRVGIFTLLALAATAVVIIYISDIGLRARGYPIAIHFRDVGSLQEGASVMVSGVIVGDVQKIRLLPDQTVLAVAVINKGTKVYRESRFIVSSTLTGQSTLAIKAPPDVATATPLEPGVPDDPNKAPWGVLPPTIGDLVTETQTQMKSLEKTVAVINVELPKIAKRFDNVAAHTDHLITSADANFTVFSASLNSTVAQLNRVIKLSGSDIVSLTGHLNSLVTNNSQRVQQLVDALSDTAKNLNKTMANFASLTGDPTIKQSLVQTAVNFKDASERLKTAAADLQGLTSDPNVQSELRGTISNLNAVTAKANDILGGFSSATAPTPSGNPPRNVSPSAAPPNGPQSTPPPANPPNRRRNSVSSLELVEPQVRLYWSKKVNGGPTSDLNLTLRPRGLTSVTVGANSLGSNATYNALLNHRLSKGFTLSWGVIYSNLGLKAVYQPGVLGIDARLYNSKNPTLDLYGDVRLAHKLQLFYGERNIIGPGTQTPTFGLQTNF